ncbi:zinc finger protein Elbow isoform X2 [Drosophila subpulchrella]|uniref:zinc finger protein Elbow isoform X2 n=1 Tax=Drosophila subpulchrella TaxID=1486046 RepID=UPI0018A1A943|nr:zinc finger protein Elbow isoform X2 [Drosophila subpulchrella]
MLQSSNHHYLRPDYMTAAAAPTALDNKSSPLALLAQTCSAIGADTTNPKLLAANIEKSTKQLHHQPKGSSGGGSGSGSGAFGLGQQTSMDGGGRDKSSPVSSHSSSVSTGSVEQQQLPMAHGSNSSGSISSKPTPTTFKPYEPNNNISNMTTAAIDCGATNLSSNNPSGQQRVKTPKSTANGGGQRCDSNQSASSHRESPTAAAGSLRRTPTSGMGGGGQLNGSPGLPPSSSGRSSSKESAAMHSPSAAAAAAAAAAQIASSNRLQEAALAAAKEASYVKALHAASQQGSAAAASYYPPGYGSPYSMDLMTASSLMSPHHAMFKASAMNPYLNYARMKGLTEQSMMAATPNVCRDPYCTGCPASPHYINKASGQPCPAGCPQCEGGGGGGGGGGGAPKSSNSQGGSGSSAAAAAAAAAASSYHAQLAALAAASQMPYVCSWIGSDAAYCGKRFGTSDDLFQHLRTHTASVPDAVLSAAAAGGIPPNHPLFQRTYPTPPLSPLSAARYHPYGKPSMLPPSLAPPGMPGLPPHPALAQYFAPYSLYGPRMGSSHP